MGRRHISSFALAGLVLLTSDQSLRADPPKVENAEIVEATGDPDPFAGGSGHADDLPKVSVTNADKKTATVLLRYETYELPTISAIALMDGETDDSTKRADILQLVKESKAVVVECLASRFEAGMTGTLENIVERIYPTEYEPPEGLPSESSLHRPDEQLTPMDRQLKVAMMHACPTAFDTKNVGVTLEAEISGVTAIEKHWDVALAFTRVKYLKEVTWVEETITMPIFGVTSSKHFLRMEDNKWNLLSSQVKVTKEGFPDPGTTHLTFLKVRRVR